MNRKSFTSTQPVGLILRVYSNKEEDIPDRVAMIEKAIKAARQMVVEGIQLIKRIDILVWADANYADSDCGGTAHAMRKALHGEKGVYVSEIKNADIFCGILNHGIMLQSMRGITYSIIASSEAFSYMTPETGEAMVDAACKGARAIPVAITELTQSILEGRGANTFMMWHNMSLMTAGGFDMKAAKPVNERMAHYMRGWSDVKGDVYYMLSGVEEIIPLIRMKYNMPNTPFIAPIIPAGEGVKAYIIPDPATQPEAWARHYSKMGTKFERQCVMASCADADLSVLKGAVMDEYRRF